MSKSITFVHLWNNYSGSPNVLNTVVGGLTDRGYKTTVISSFNNDGFLSDVNCSKRINVKYEYKRNIVLRLLGFLRFQLIAAYAISKTNKSEIIYINTIQPFLPALVAKLRRQKIIYHIHEAYPEKSYFQSFLFFVVNRTSSRIICVSNYVKDELDKSVMDKATVVYNSLDNSFLSGMMAGNTGDSNQHILMISSARIYKGVLEFCELAKRLPQYNFTLVCDTDKNEIRNLFGEYLSIKNLDIYPTQKNVHPFYAKAHLILNLSNPKQIIETFGLTILEGMAYGIPAIVPTVGGISELVNEGTDGYHIDVSNMDMLEEKIKMLLENSEFYSTISRNALKKSTYFKSDKQLGEIEKIVRN